MSRACEVSDGAHSQWAHPSLSYTQQAGTTGSLLQMNITDNRILNLIGIDGTIYSYPVSKIEWPHYLLNVSD